MTPTYIAELRLVTQKTDAGAQTINESALMTYGIGIVSFPIQNRLKKVWFFEKTFLLADTSMGLVLEMLFLTFSDADLWFAKKELIWISYTIAEALPTTNKVKLIDKKEFAKVILDRNSETFMVNIASILETMSIHLARKTQIALLQAQNALTKVPAEYFD